LQPSSDARLIPRQLRICGVSNCTRPRLAFGRRGINSAVSALRLVFTVTLDLPDLSRRLAIVHEPRKLPLVLSVEEVARLPHRRTSPAPSAGKERVPVSFGVNQVTRFIAAVMASHV
jgi:hypothetical protein